MSQLDEPPLSPEEEDANWAPAKDVSSAAPAEKISFRFSLARLLLAMAAAPLPMVLFANNNPFVAWVFAFCGLTLAGAVFLVRAEDLPRINTGVTVMLIIAIAAACATGTFDFWGVAFWSMLGAIPGFFYAHGQYPYYVRGAGKDHKEAPRCESVLATGAWIYVGLNWIAWKNVAASIGESGLSGPGLVLMTVFVLLIPINIIWVAGEKGARLDQRPELGFYYELTLIGIPLASLCILLKGL
ncbi:hypothetical protein LOC68_19855 [Blastopirellula sp. JC732]|uniref:Uncharacterized protein n=1 Tax=Blastopirellula sediminis TaxID=2894196 RepID=A0A9X1SIB2_9BACT|nr:hypothetical protein [Blastopirellula sediminis]MCC9606045.1 hypothetical protein [Blastopirellula sediminis]MCC9630656.1 hypothetical protein [Blastopirellula sediminis]